MPTNLFGDKNEIFLPSIRYMLFLKVYLVKIRLNLYSVFLTSMLLTVLACSNKKDGTASRWYHNTTAHYNGYFNAEEILRKNNAKVVEAHKEDFDKILPIFIYSEPEEAKAAYPDMERAIAKCEKVIRRHTISNESKKNKKRPVRNKWIDDNHIVVGKAYFYKRNFAKAAELFNYVNRKYKDPEITMVTNTWLAKTYVAQEEYGKAIQVLERVKLDAKMEKKNKADYFKTYADVLLKQGKTEKAAVKLQEAIKSISKKKDKARPHFILAQMYQEMNESSDALANYEMVIKSRPTYELEFYSRINKAISFSRQGGSSAEIKKELLKMLKDDKNINYRDQIYFALGDIAIEEQARAEAIDFFEKSLATNKDNKKQKAKTFLKLADLYFNERQYVSAQLYYDSTLTTIAADHERYNIVKTRAESLTELVASLDAIALNDSLKTLCDLSPSERNKRLERAAQQLAENAADQKRKDELAAQVANVAAVQGISGTFWCYNENLRKKGQEIFLNNWGVRPLKDNWRLQSRLATSYGPGEESGTAASDSTAGAINDVVDDKYKTPTADELKSTLPCGDNSKMNNLLSEAAEGYYNAGIIYKEKLNDDDNAISTWEELIANMDESDFHPTTYYQLFRTWLNKEQSKGYTKNPFCSTCNSKYWGDEIKTRYQGSDWAMLVDNPGYLDVQDMKNSQESEAYKSTYALYTSRNYLAAISSCDSVITGQPDNHLRCKYRLLKAVCIGYTGASYGSKEIYQNELNALAQSCSGTEEATRAQELLKAMNVGSATADVPKEPKTDESNSITNEDNPEVIPQNPNSPFKYDAVAEHYLAVLLPMQGSDINQARAAISDFNTAYFASAPLKVTNNLLNKDFHLVLVKSFKVLTEAKDYVATFTADKEKLKSVNETAGNVFLISKQNYIALFKNKDAEMYMQFYNANY